jgi:hypothetical protein
MTSIDTSHQAGPDNVEKHKDLSVRRGTDDGAGENSPAGDAVKLFHSGAFDTHASNARVEMHTRDTARARAIKSGGTGDTVSPPRNQP